MPSYHFIDSKSPINLVPENHIIHKDSWYRVVENYSVLGYPGPCRRMLVIVPSHLINPTGYLFLEITTEHKIDAYIRKD